MRTPEEDVDLTEKSRTLPSSYFESFERSNSKFRASAANQQST